ETNDWNEQIAHRSRRSSGLYQLDRQMEQRKSHRNPAVLQLYRDFLGHPGSEQAHRLLHTGFHSRRLYAPEPLPKKEHKQKVPSL
ncbi:MAG: hypothetical protein GX883_05120, partial [Firmicutes bacterium]|nr:hypothetical protein [Bacillota bacterium]